MEKIIFLDFDGVLNTEHYQNYLKYERKPWQPDFITFLRHHIARIENQ